MNAHDELNPESRSDTASEPSNDAAEAASKPEAVEKPAHPAETLGSAQAAGAEGGGAPKVEPPRLNLIPYLAPSQAEAKAAPRPVGLGRWVSGLAAGLAAVAAVTAVGLYDHARQSNIIAAKAEESLSLAQTVKALKDRIDAIEATRARDESADLRKIAAEIKAEGGATHDLTGALAQLASRVDRVDHDQNARLDKLAERIDHDPAARLAELGARIDKLEKRPPAAVVASVTPPPAPPTPTPAPKPAVSTTGPKPDVLVSNETTGSIDKPRPTVRGYWLVEVQGDYALIDGRDGPQQVGPGDVLPGVGRVIRLERHGRDWVLVTSAGVIAGDQSRF
jgi:hypothetical protein